MRKRWPLIAISAAWVLAGVTIFLSGKWVGETSSDGPAYSECKPIDWTGRPGWLCFPAEEPEIKTSEGDEA